MTQEKVLNKTLELLEQEGTKKAYAYLKDQKDQWETLDSQYYNFLYCLAALEGQSEEALRYLEEAIIDQGMWYRPEVFDDDDLKLIWDTDRFKKCQSISDERYQEVAKSAQTLSTWNAKEKPCLALTLHGNQQNIQMCQNHWGFLEELGYQVEYVQSKHVDSYGIYRWEDDQADEEQLKRVVRSITWEQYDKTVLCGFSAGCNVILKTMLDANMGCDTLVLQSPWIPMIEASIEPLVEALKTKGIKVIIICGRQDHDCFEQSQALYKALNAKGVEVKKQWIDGLGHEFSPNHKTLVTGLLE